MNKNLTLIAVTAGLLATASAHAEPHWKKTAQQSFWDHAKVVNVEPIVRHVQVSTPQRECWQEEVRRPVTVHHDGNRAGSTLAGAIIGGVIGHQFGGGSGKRVATAVGTMLGASIGSEAARAHEYAYNYDQVSEETRCTTHVDYHTEERIEGYRVTYRYHGEVFTTQLPYDPGKRLRVRVDIRPE